jgi:hypothetical protein
VITDRHVYRWAADASAGVTEGQVLHEDDNLTDAFELRACCAENALDGVAKITIPPGFFTRKVNSDDILEFSNDNGAQPSPAKHIISEAFNNGLLLVLKRPYRIYEEALRAVVPPYAALLVAHAS